jgi:hypothetical protein
MLFFVHLAAIDLKPHQMYSNDTNDATSSWSFRQAVDPPDRHAEQAPRHHRHLGGIRSYAGNDESKGSLSVPDFIVPS